VPDVPNGMCDDAQAQEDRQQPVMQRIQHHQSAAEAALQAGAPTGQILSRLQRLLYVYTTPA
jgi:uncharacterized membrane protein